MRRVILALILLALTVSTVFAHEATPAPAAISAAPQAVAETPAAPADKGLPVLVRTALSVMEIASVNENDGLFTGTVDLRLRWEDSRLGYPPAEAPPGGFVDLRGDLADARLAEIWAPSVALANLIDTPTHQVRRLRISPDGRVELMQRTTGRFATSFNVEKFPFDRQELTVDLVERREPLHRLALDFRQDDVEFSQVAPGITIDGWRTGLLHLRRDPMPAWYGESQARVHAAMEINREPGKTVAGLFLPLLASLLIPLLALWLQRVDDGVIQIETFELSNILIGGLFAVIALNFTISGEHPTLVDGDNAVTRLLALNYLCLAINLVINVFMFRFNWIGRCFGKHILTQTFRYLTWALPLLVLATAAAIILLAMA
ncbi:MAG: hypothetical protein NTZ05_20460 [Chloroflexi bacterium]|nr:hypothetical protein [Chloroflexota bacterium]